CLWRRAASFGRSRRRGRERLVFAGGRRVLSNRVRQLPKSPGRRWNKAKRVFCRAEKNQGTPTFLRSQRDWCFLFQSSGRKRADGDIPNCASLLSDRAERGRQL